MATDPTGNIVRNLFTLRRQENGLAAEVDLLIRALFDDIVAELARIDPAGVVADSYRRRRVERLIAEVEELTGQTFGEVLKLTRNRAAAIGSLQANFAEGVLRTAVGSAAIKIRPNQIGQFLLRSIIDTDPIQGHLLKDWFQGQERAVPFRVRQQVQLGMVQNETIDDIVRRIRGRSVGFRVIDGERVRAFSGGVMQTTTREAEAIVRTAVNHVANEAHLRTYQDNLDITTEYEYVAVLDSRTCFLAGTPVLTPTGTRPIESIRTGDVVIGGSRVPRRVEGTRQASTHAMVTVRLSNGQEVRCTPDHLWLTAAHKWCEANDLRPGQALAYRLNLSYIQGREDSLRHVWESAFSHGRQEAGRLSYRSSLLLARVLSCTSQQATGLALRRLPCPPAIHGRHGLKSKVLLPRLPGGKQAARSKSVPYVRGGVLRDPHPEWLREVAPTLDLLKYLSTRVLPNERRTEAEDRSSVSWSGAPQLAGWEELRLRRSVPWAGLAPDSSARQKEGWLPLRGLRLPRVRSTGAEHPSHRAVPQLLTSAGCEPDAEPEGALSFLSRENREASPARADDDPAGTQQERTKILSETRSQGEQTPARRSDGSDRAHASRSHPPGRETIGRRTGDGDQLQDGALGGEGTFLEAPPVVWVESVGFSLIDATVYDIQVQKDQSFIVGGVVVHNSMICMGLDGQRFHYDDPNGKRPPQHVNCRSGIVPVIDWAALGIDPPDEGTRASVDGQVKASTTYEDWLRGRSAAEQDEILGPARAKLFRAGKINLRDLVRGDNSIVTLEELAA